ncbi:MAG TPA: DUF488 family protein, partial [Gemmatimonadaceae bacterium]
MARIFVKRAYDPPAAADGTRFFVERLWPRGVKKAALAVAAWIKEVAPSAALRTWYAHDPAKWPEFRRRYLAELAANPDALRPLLDAVRRGPVTLVFAARDVERNSAVVLKRFLERRGPGARAAPKRAGSTPKRAA